MVSQLKVNEIIKQSGSSITIGVDGDTVSGPFTNVPAFFAYLSSDQTIANLTDVKIQFDTEVFDTDSAYNNSTNYRFTVPSGKAGKYSVSVSCWIDDLDDLDFGLIRVYKNGSQATNPQIQDQRYASGSGQNQYFNITSVMDLSVADYIEVYARHNQGADQSLKSGYTWFTMHRLTGA